MLPQNYIKRFFFFTMEIQTIGLNMYIAVADYGIKGSIPCLKVSVKATDKSRLLINGIRKSIFQTLSAHVQLLH